MQLGGADWDDFERKCVAIKQHTQQSSTADLCYIVLQVIYVLKKGRDESFTT